MKITIEIDGKVLEALDTVDDQQEQEETIEAGEPDQDLFALFGEEAAPEIP